jgi:sirohydrochlorin cobaltochelatase
MIDKKGLLIVSFGTSYPETEKKCINSIENNCTKIFTDFEVRRAFTSQTIISKLGKQGRKIFNTPQAVEKMKQEGFSHLIVQPLLFLKGYEFEKKIAAPFKKLEGDFKGFTITNPLLCSEKDISVVAQWVGELSDSLKGEKILFMGHGTGHSFDSVYSKLWNKINSKKIDAQIATVEGRLDFDSVLKEYKQKAVQKVHLFPLMLVAGDHARKDLSGAEDSWEKQLKAAGIQAVPHLKGMGESMKIQGIFIKHIRAGKRKLFPEKYERMKQKAENYKITVPREDIPWFPSIKQKKCNGCGLCYLYCHRDVYSYNESLKKSKVENPYHCVVNCSFCASLCYQNAIQFPAEKIELK